MSAFIVGNKHINVMLQAATRNRYPGHGLSYYWNREPHYFNGNTQDIGQKLVDENYRSVNHRYGEQETPDQFKTMVLDKCYTPVEIIKACDCYRYQSCETPDWQDTEAHAIMVALRERAIRLLPGYDDADWGIA